MGTVVAILGTRYPDFRIEEEVLAPLGVELRRGAGATTEEIVAVAADAAVILAGSGPRFDEATLRQLACRGIVRYGVGTDAIDLDAAGRAGIWVARVADYGTEAVSVHAVTLALAGIRRLAEANARVRAGDWGFADLRP
ncbi:MAG: C-terminal binding protein, partial [Egibacteraceae bacterium]